MPFFHFFADDFPVAMQISHKYSLIYVITKLGLLFVYDLETATAIYRNRISSDLIFLTAKASSAGGFYAINRQGQVLLATVNEATIVPFLSGQYVLEQFGACRQSCKKRKPTWCIVLDGLNFLYTLELKDIVFECLECKDNC